MTWSIVLAGGTGSRLADQARLRYGYARPKQFCDFDGTGTLLAKTLRRAARLSSPGRTAVVTTRDHRAETAEARREAPGVAWLEQPRSRETTPAIALPLLHVLGVEPGQSVVLLPSDHHIADEGLFAGAVEEAVDLVTRDPRRVAILGADPGAHADGYGWIVPGADGAVARFREKPPASELVDLRKAGALVNTFVLVARAETLAGLLGQHATRWWHALERAWPNPTRIEAIYELLGPSNFSTEVLERATDRLSLVRVPMGAGWSDIGTPARLAHALTPGPAPERVSALAL